MGTIFGWIFKQIAPYVTPVIGVTMGLLLLSTLGLGWLYKNQLELNAVQDSYITDLQGEIVNLNSQIVDEQEENKRVVNEKSILSASFRQAKHKLQSMKGNISNVVSNPENERVRVQESYDVYINEIRCITGDIQQCTNSSQ